MPYITSLAVEKVSEPKKFWHRAKWRVLQPLVYRYVTATHDITYTVPPGFVSDFASVPRWVLVFFLFGDTAHSSAVIHDWLLQFGDPKFAAKVFESAMEDEGTPSWRLNAMFNAVKFFGPKK